MSPEEQPVGSSPVRGVAQVLGSGLLLSLIVSFPVIVIGAFIALAKRRRLRESEQVLPV